MQDADSIVQAENLKKAGNFTIGGAILMFFFLPPHIFGISLMFLIIGIAMKGIAKRQLEQFTINSVGMNAIPVASNNHGIVVGNVPNILGMSQPSVSPPNGNFSGIWDTEWGEIELIQKGIDVFGNFIGANLSGQVTGRKFFFDWIKADENIAGRGVLAIENGLLVGSWGHGESREDGGPIKGSPRKVDPKLVVNEPNVVKPVEETVTPEVPVAQVETVVKEESTELDKIEEIKQAAQDKKEEMSKQIKEKVEELEEKVPEEIKVTESFQEMKSTVEDTIENLDEKAEQAIEEVAVETTEQMEQVQEKIILSLDESLSKLNEALERLDKAVMSKDRESIISELAGSQMDLNLTVDRIDNTIGYGIDEALRGGKTIVGNIEGIPHPVSIKVPKSMNDFASGLKKGQNIEQKVTLSSFNSIRKMLEFVLN